ncbi:transmembrane protein 116-like, partial [Nelusetta ayraudi]|uniref:transmembrane protein 116-like n=1 Tax=Nelusetta ayraudi TaxID=303726 RepID=UPI003F7116AE
FFFFYYCSLQLQPLLLLSLSDLLLALCWLVGATLFSQRCSNVNTLCYQLHTVEQILYMASFLFTLLYMWNVYVGIREKFYGCSGGCALRVWDSERAIPVLMMLPVFIQGNLSDCQVPAHAHGATFWLMDRQMLLYPPVFFCCWGPAVALALVQVVEPSVAQGAAGVALYVSQAFTSASQGFLNCLVYGWTRLLRRGPAPSREADNQTPLLRAQKKKSSSSSYQALSGQLTGQRTANRQCSVCNDVTSMGVLCDSNNNSKVLNEPSCVTSARCSALCGGGDKRPSVHVHKHS